MDKTIINLSLDKRYFIISLHDKLNNKEEIKISKIKNIDIYNTGDKAGIVITFVVYDEEINKYTFESFTNISEYSAGKIDLFKDLIIEKNYKYIINEIIR
jgi:hypothetical protein